MGFRWAIARESQEVESQRHRTFGSMQQKIGNRAFAFADFELANAAPAFAATICPKRTKMGDITTELHCIRVMSRNLPLIGGGASLGTWMPSVNHQVSLSYGFFFFALSLYGLLRLAAMAGPPPALLALFLSHLPSRMASGVY
ncbi:hypothetical protein AXG93_2351s1070 [Marchantia polymorpha subsp. ruderalis]|uniref:Uncharacterized protein n=1 Tax=Marchantia polymorpha subsp. ruderalis TaxID=1480154 RepID=A0A176W4V2_MARPO|nr:hypothetical protein AXG93_2351s1070 [Marchantia polymorpha subsp. ruderalis]